MKNKVQIGPKMSHFPQIVSHAHSQCHIITHENDRHFAPVILVPRMYDLGPSVQRNHRICDFTRVANAKNTKKAISRNLTGTRLGHQA